MIYKIDSLTADPNQQMNLAIDGYDAASFELQFIDNQVGWFFSLTWDNFSVNNQRIVAGMDNLSAYRNLLPFSIFCISSNGVDPVTVEAFTDYAALYLVTDSDVAIARETLGVY